jgi:hypothetical protein
VNVTPNSDLDSESETNPEKTLLWLKAIRILPTTFNELSQCTGQCDLGQALCAKNLLDAQPALPRISIWQQLN